MEKTMASIANQLKQINFHAIQPLLFKQIERFENEFYKLKNKHSNTLEELEHQEYTLDLLRKKDDDHLVDISKRLTGILKNHGQDKMIEELLLARAKIMDHFTLAYMAELKLNPSEIKLVQGIDSEGYVEIYFVKNSPIILD